MDYSQTVHLPKTDFPMKADLPKREPGILAQWEKEKVYEKALARRAGQKGRNQFILHDGPPYANGPLHLGHALNKILKDLIVRYKTMAGFYAPYVPGWDCHGLPIELQLMKELQVADKHQVERTSFRAQAAAFAQKFVDSQRLEFKRLGVLGDWEHPYLTMDDRYKRVIVDTFKELEAKGYVYRGKKPVHWCAVDETALAEAEVEYEDVPSPSIYVAFPVQAIPKAPAEEWTDGDISFVIWTTTPWTIPANVAIAFNANERYALIRHTANQKKYIVAEKLLEAFQKISGLALEPLDQARGEAFEGATARHPWIPFRSVHVLPADFVAMDAGTGLVHIAPGHGMEDYQLGQRQSPPLPVLSPVDDRGRFTEDFGDLKVKGEAVFKANFTIVEFLKNIGALLYAEEIAHSYPHCWRCHKPVIFRATEQWFLSIDKPMEHGQTLRERLLEIIEKEVRWIPAYGQNRIAGMVETRPDWCLSRQRLWGTEIPVGDDAKGKAPDIIDVWFESGVSWAAVLQQPSPWPDLSYPADLYLEGSDQHRGWFQTSLIPSVALKNRAPYRSVLTHGFVMDGEGRPMSKSLGNVISPEAIIRQYGADVLRLWVASSDYAGDVRLGPEILKGLSDSYRKVRNTLRYLLGNVAGFDPHREAVSFQDMPEIDRWALSKLQAEIAAIHQAYEAYEFHRVTSRLLHFCSSTLSGFYLDLLKDRLYCDPSGSLSRRSAQTVLWHLADRLIRLWAPILPFTADEAWRLLGHPEAVHLADFPKADPALQLAPSESRLDAVFPVREQILGALEKARQSGRIKGNLEARVILHASDPDLAALLKRYANQWAALCLVSEAAVSAEALPATDAESSGLQIKAERTTGRKCARCWIYKHDLGTSPEHPDLCARCAGAVAGLPAGQTGAPA